MPNIPVTHSTERYDSPGPLHHPAPPLIPKVRKPNIPDIPRPPVIPDVLGRRLSELGAQLFTMGVKQEQARRANEIAGAVANATMEMQVLEFESTKDYNYQEYERRFTDGSEAILEKYSRGFSDDRARQVFMADMQKVRVKSGLDVRKASLMAGREVNKAATLKNLDVLANIAAGPNQVAAATAEINARALLATNVKNGILSPTDAVAFEAEFKNDVNRFKTEAAIRQNPKQMYEQLADTSVDMGMDLDTRRILTGQALSAWEAQEKESAAAAERSQKLFDEALKIKQSNNYYEMITRIKAGDDEITYMYVNSMAQSRNISQTQFNSLQSALDSVNGSGSGWSENTDTRRELETDVANGISVLDKLEDPTIANELSGPTIASLIDKSEKIENNTDLFTSPMYKDSASAISKSLSRGGALEGYTKAGETAKLGAMQELQAITLAGELTWQTQFELVKKWEEAADIKNPDIIKMNIPPLDYNPWHSNNFPADYNEVNQIRASLRDAYSGTLSIEDQKRLARINMQLDRFDELYSNFDASLTK